MPPDKRNPGGQLGNLNAAKNIWSALRRVQQGKPLPPELARVVALAEREAEMLISDKGGRENMSGAEQLMIGIWRSGRQCELLIWFELLERGAIQANEDGSWDLQPGAQRLAQFLGQQRAALQVLGLERRARDVTALDQYLKEKGYHAQ